MKTYQERLDYFIAHAPTEVINKHGEEYLESPTPTDDADRAVSFALAVMRRLGHSDEEVKKETTNKVNIMVGVPKDLENANETTSGKLGGVVRGPMQLNDSNSTARQSYGFQVINKGKLEARVICSVPILDFCSQYCVECSRTVAQSIADAFDNGLIK